MIKPTELDRPVRQARNAHSPEEAAKKTKAKKKTAKRAAKRASLEAEPDQKDAARALADARRRTKS